MRKFTKALFTWNLSPLQNIELSRAKVPAYLLGIHVDCGFFALERTLS